MDAFPKLLARLATWKLALTVFGAGALSVLAMAPFFLWPVMFLTFPALVWTIDAVSLRAADREEPLKAFVRRLRRAAFIGWAFGFGYFLASVYWVGYAFFVDADRYAILMPFAVIGLAAGLGLFYALPAVLAAALWQKGYARLLAFAFAFFCAEAGRGYLLTGFPWNLFGEALAATGPHMQIAAFTGVYGLTLAALLIFPAPAAAIAAPDARFNRLFLPLIVGAIALTGSYAWGVDRLRMDLGEVAGTRLRIVQPNIPQQEKYKPENQRWIFDRILTLSRDGMNGENISAFTHVIWPESSVPFLFGFNREIYIGEVRDLIAGLIPHGTTLILGGERAEGILSVDKRYTFNRAFNSLFVLGAGGTIETIYDKKHLVPFGEYTPLEGALALVGFRVFSHRSDGFQAGSGPVSLVETQGAPAFLPLICYEIIFPGRVSNKKKRPGWIVNVTNDAWFGESTGPYQHLHQARIRAVEEGLPVIRAANTGISAVIDPFGRVLTQLDLATAGTIDHSLPRSLAATFYERFRLSLFVAYFLFPLYFYIVFLFRGKV